jgi:hypothetical protein
MSDLCSPDDEQWQMHQAASANKAVGSKTFD